MKVLTLTFQFANNMGALLQCYALSHFLNMQDGVHCEVIQYYPKGWRNSWTIFHRPSTFRDIMKFLFEIFNIKGYKRRKAKNDKTRAFIAKNIPLTKERYEAPSSIMKNPPQADLFICGSDQIWNLTLYGDVTYFLSFLPSGSKGIKASYAASIADDWTPQQEVMVKPYLERFDCISIREHGNLEQVKKLVDKDVRVIIDPVFLLDSKTWYEIAPDIDIHEPYLLCYFLSVSPLAIKAVQKMRELTGLKIVYLNHNSLDKFGSDTIVPDFDPGAFVSYIANATYVCTNSFHCSAFSIIFKRNFMFVPGMRNKRVETLQQVFNLGDRFASRNRIEQLTLEDLTVNYGSKENAGEDLIAESKDFLVHLIELTKQHSAS